MKLRRGWYGVLIYAAVVSAFMAAMVGFYLSSGW